MTKVEEQLRQECNNWKETAAQYARNTEYYRDLVVQIGKMFGKKAYISDDNSIHQDVLCAKVPELVKELILDYFILSGAI